MKFFTDSLHKIAYATDASVYREIPYGVAYPETIEDIRELMRMARERQVKNRFFVEGDPAALLITELRAETVEELDAKAAALEKDLLDSGLVYLNTRVYEQYLRGYRSWANDDRE